MFKLDQIPTSDDLKIRCHFIHVHKCIKLSLDSCDETIQINNHRFILFLNGGKMIPKLSLIPHIPFISFSLFMSVLFRVCSSDYKTDIAGTNC